MRRVLILAALVTLAGCGGGDQPPATSADAGGAGRRSLEGKPLSLDQFRGKPVLVNVWSSW